MVHILQNHEDLWNRIRNGIQHSYRTVKCFHLAVKIRTNCTIHAFAFQHSHTHGGSSCLCQSSVSVSVSLRVYECIDVCVCEQCCCVYRSTNDSRDACTYSCKNIASAIMNFPVINTCRWVSVLVSVCARTRTRA